MLSKEAVLDVKEIMKQMGITSEAWKGISDDDGQAQPRLAYSTNQRFLDRTSPTAAESR
jgi:hypothetical protein